MNNLENIYTQEEASSLLSTLDLSSKEGAVMESQIKKFQIVHLTLAFSPERDFVKELVTYVREAIKSPLILLDIKINKEILGGAQIAFRGKYLDESLVSKI